MYNLLVAFAVGAVALVLVGLGLGWIPAILPAIALAGVTSYLLSRRVNAAVEPELARVAGLLQARKVDEATAALRRVKAQWGPWQVFLAAQMDAQMGMIAYLQMKFDDAMPLLERGAWLIQAGKYTAQPNPTVLACFAAIQYRKGLKDQAFVNLDQATEAGTANDIGPYLVHGVLAEREGRREEALKAVDRGLKAKPNAQPLVDLRDWIANKRKVDTRRLGEVWYQYFPEDLVAQYEAYQAYGQVKGRKNPEERPPLPPGVQPPPEPKMNRAQRRAMEKKRS